MQSIPDDDSEEIEDFENLALDQEQDEGEWQGELEVPTIAAKFAIPSDVGDKIDEEVAVSINYMLNHKLEPKMLEDTALKYPPPMNCHLLDSPKVNPGLWENVNTPTKTNDLKLQRIQKSLTRGLNAFASTLSGQFITEAQQDALALLCNANFELNSLRKDFIKPCLNNRFTHLCKPTNPVTKFLFGDDLSKQVKELNEEQKATAGVMKSNFSGPKGRRQFNHPYSDRNRFAGNHRPFKGAGWVAGSRTRSSVSNNSGRPFLGQTTGRPQKPYAASQHKGRNPPSSQAQRKQ